MLPEHPATQMFNPQAIQTHYQHPAMSHAMVSSAFVTHNMLLQPSTFLELATELWRRRHNADQWDHGGEEWNFVRRRNVAASAAASQAQRLQQNWSSAEAAAIQHRLHGRSAQADVNVLQHAFPVRSQRRDSKAEWTAVHRQRAVPEDREVLHWRAFGALRPDEPAFIAIPVTVSPATHVPAANDAQQWELRESLCRPDAPDASRDPRGTFASWSLYGEQTDFAAIKIRKFKSDLIYCFEEQK